jgi:hypothetical protein
MGGAGGRRRGWAGGGRDWWALTGPEVKTAPPKRIRFPLWHTVDLITIRCCRKIHIQYTGCSHHARAASWTTWHHCTLAHCPPYKKRTSLNSGTLTTSSQSGRKIYSIEGAHTTREEHREPRGIIVLWHTVHLTKKKVIELWHTVDFITIRQEDIQYKGFCI